MELSHHDPFPSEPPPSSRSRSVPPGLQAGIVVAGKYELLRKLGTGAMGEVWAARHVSLEEEVAIKLVMRDVAHDDGTTAESRFLLEARVAAALSRKTRHIVTVTDHGEDGPLAYLVMELLNGESLDALLARVGPMPLAKAVPIVTQIARGLAVAHAEGIVHRDLKPSNVFVTRDEDGRSIVKILDFGIAKLRASVRKLPIGPRATDGSAQATMHGFLLGTPAFMSPEQASGKGPIDARADVWALAVIAYHLLTGQYPFDGATLDELLERLCRVRPRSLSTYRPDLPPIAADFFGRAFARPMRDRFQSAIALAGAFEQLEPLAAGALPSSRPPPPSQAPSVEPPASAASADESLYVAGVPRRRRIWSRLAVGGLVATVLVGTGAIVSVYYERDPEMGARLTAGANVGAVGGPTMLPAREAIPEPAAPSEPSEPSRVSEPSEPSEPATAAAPAHAPIARAPARPASRSSAAPTATTTSPTEKSPRTYDRSEVF